MSQDTRGNRPGGSATPGHFGIQATVSNKFTSMDKVLSGRLAVGSPPSSAAFNVPETKIYHWLLSAGGVPAPDGSGVRLEVVDSHGRVVRTLEAPAGQDVSLDLLLEPGSYTLRFAQKTVTSLPGSSLTFAFKSMELSDSINPYPSDTSLTPVGAAAPAAEAALGPAAAADAGSGTGVRVAMVLPASSPYLNVYGGEGGTRPPAARGPGVGIASRVGPGRGQGDTPAASPGRPAGDPAPAVDAVTSQTVVVTAAAAGPGPPVGAWADSTELPGGASGWSSLAGPLASLDGMLRPLGSAISGLISEGMAGVMTGMTGGKSSQVLVAMGVVGGAAAAGRYRKLVKAESAGKGA